MRKCSSRYRTYRLLLFSHAYWSRVYMQHLINKRKISNNGMKSIHVLFCLDSKLIKSTYDIRCDNYNIMHEF